ncbi:HlyD family secretion protein [Niveibacterium umoris]|uniref:Multidrug resistance efflux pump n=1 Tax=Niveibacterium umoris TaxID=1193620 RepID=A0A840BGB2_9RHOO|nr:HlyD family secretion protein [Niveibacterium umoris]MBB4012581.1 multidrug resistance efflux pump [Niveibacterium umoris]
MEAILVGIYAFFVWLIFFKFKLLPWNTTSKVIVVTIPVVGLTWLILTLNVIAPSSADIRVLKYTVQVVPQVRGRVIAVPAEGNVHMKKGDVLFKIDPTPYEQTVRSLESQLASAIANAKNLNEQLKAASSKTEGVKAQIDLANRRVAEFAELAKTEAGNKFDLEQAQANVKQLQAEHAAALASERQIKEQMGAQVNGEQAQVANVRAQLENAKWELSQTTMYAPSDGTVINNQLRVGSWVVPMPLQPAMVFVEDEQQIIALYQQNELYNVEPGNEAEIALPTYPGEIIKAKVQSIVWAQGQGQIPMSGQIPQTGPAPLPPGRFAVKFELEDKHRDLFLAAGAVGHGAIYTEHIKPVQLVRRVIVRVNSILNYLVLKLH